MLATSTSSSAAKRRTSFSAAPIIAAIPPEVAAHASSINSPRFCTSLSPLAKSNVPAAACAVISPNDKPAAPPTGNSPASSRKIDKHASP
jgi:hypothetical protein